jgi:hypothetical protein
MLGSKKALLTALVATALIAGAPTASAGHRYHGYYGPPGHYYGPGYYKRRHNGHNEAAYLVGGLLLGGLITHAYHESRAVYPAPRVERVYPAPAAGQRLVRDARGNCFSSEFDGAGTEYRTPVDPALCNW